MKVSTKGRYGIRALVDMAVFAGNEHVSLSSIAERQEVSENYLEQVFSALRKAGIVKSVKGAQGGYVLADRPGNITIGRVLRVLEGDLSLVEESAGAEGNGQSGIGRVIRAEVWDRMTEELNKFVDSVTLEELAEDYRRMNGLLAPMYYI